MDLTGGEWVFVGLLAVWATITALGEPLAGFLGAYVGGVVLAVIVIGGKRRVNGWRRARTTDT